MEAPDWERLVQNWSDGHLKLAWTRYLLKLRNELADVFTHGDYEPLEVSGTHGDHVIAFARRYGGAAAIISCGETLAPLSQAGRVWPRADDFEGTLDLARLYRATAALHRGAARLRYSGTCRPRC